MKLLKYAMLPFIALSCFACSDDDESAIKNDMIKKTVSPAIAGEKIEFAYAMGTTNGRINKAEAVASITGATGTGFELHSWFTAQTGMDVNGVHYGAGEDVPIQTVKDASTDGSISTANPDGESRCALHQPDHCHRNHPDRPHCRHTTL
ncbi:DUF4466 family protein [Bacteroides uniformis]|nr:DUF4466 family protein [Bacteroides uniformis]